MNEKTKRAYEAAIATLEDPHSGPENGVGAADRTHAIEHLRWLLENASGGPLVHHRVWHDAAWFVDVPPQSTIGVLPNKRSRNIRLGVVICGNESSVPINVEQARALLVLINLAIDEVDNHD